MSENRVAIYVRSSTDKHDVSCEAQEDQIRKKVDENNEKIGFVFCDKGLSSTKDKRPAFDEMVSLAMSQNPPFRKIYCLDTSRFGRDDWETQALLWELRKKHGIEVIFINMPHTGTYLDTAFERIMSAFDYIHSQQSKIKGVASMKQNIKSGYRAGGRAPYGYRLKEIELDVKRDGKNVVKTQLEPDPETAPVVKEYFERRALGETRKSILEDFFRRGIASPSGNAHWNIPSAKAFEDNIEVYLGHLVFNRHNEKIKVRGQMQGYLGGKKWRPREEWVVNERCHEPLITEEVAAKIREIKKRGIREVHHGKRIYALGGIIKCGICGTSYSGDRGIYRCSSQSRAGIRCENNDISQDQLERMFATFIKENVLNFKNIKDFMNRVKSNKRNAEAESSRIGKRLAQVEREISRLLKVFRKSIIDERELEAELIPLKRQKEALESELDHHKALHQDQDITDDLIQECIENFTDAIQDADPKIRKRAMQALFEKVVIYPKEGKPWTRIIEVKGTYLPLTRVNVASPTWHPHYYENLKLLITLKV